MATNSLWQRNIPDTVDVFVQMSWSFFVWFSNQKEITETEDRKARCIQLMSFKSATTMMQKRRNPAGWCLADKRFLACIYHQRWALNDWRRYQTNVAPPRVPGTSSEKMTRQCQQNTFLFCADIVMQCIQDTWEETTWLPKRQGRLSASKPHAWVSRFSFQYLPQGAQQGLPIGLVQLFWV